ncbi:hypothetical protein M758_UG167000 [Ceratodon purpureus]|nr:hypothetical protein M758_UG167000 [Ceratodon purpureus]
MYVDVAQIHYKENDHLSVRVESDVREVFHFEPPLKEGWFPLYMRRRLEKSRSLFRKYHDETRKRHPDCHENRYSALLAWWATPAGSNRSLRMKEYNAVRSARNQATGVGAVQNEVPVSLPSPANDEFISPGTRHQHDQARQSSGGHKPGRRKRNQIQQ